MASRFVSFSRLAAFPLLVVACAPLAAQQVGAFQRTFTVATPARLDITNGAGTIRVVAGDAHTVSVQATINSNRNTILGFVFNAGSPADVRGIEQHPPLEQFGNQIRISALSGALDRAFSISYLITVPAAIALQVRDGSGTIAVAGLAGMADLTTGSGGIRIADLPGSVRASTGSGGIQFDRIGGTAYLSTGSGGITGNTVDGPLTAKTGSGSISLHRLGQSADLRTSSGGIQVEQIAADLTAHASNGHLIIAGAIPPHHHWDLSTSSGGIDLTLTPATTVQVRLHANSGTVHVPPAASPTPSNHHDWQGTIGPPTPPPTATLTATTSSGSIHIN